MSRRQPVNRYCTKDKLLIQLLETVRLGCFLLYHPHPDERTHKWHHTAVSLTAPICSDMRRALQTERVCEAIEGAVAPCRTAFQSVVV